MMRTIEARFALVAMAMVVVMVCRWWWFGPLVGPSAGGSVVRALRVTIPCPLPLSPFTADSSSSSASLLLHDVIALSLFFSFLSLSLSVLLGQAFSPAFPRSFYRERTSRVTLPPRLANMAAVRLVYLLRPPRRGQKTHEESAFCAPPVPTISVEPPRSLISSEK